MHARRVSLFQWMRKLLFLLALLITGFAAYKIYTKYSSIANLPVKIKITKNGADIEIKKFKVVHEISGHKSWELKADYAEIDNKKKLTKLKNVQLEFQRKKNQKYWVSADNGTLKNDTKDFELEGSVRLVAQSESFVRQIHSQKKYSKDKAQ